MMNKYKTIILIVSGIILALVSGYFFYAKNQNENEPKILEVKLYKTVSGLGVTLTPTAVLEDSRCPVDVQCIWAGRVKVWVKVQSGLGESLMIFEPDQPMTTEAEQITLKEVLPQNKSGIKIQDDEYRFRFEVSKRDPSVLR